MDRRTFLATGALAGVTSLGGCVAGGRVVHEHQGSVTVEATRGWTYRITDVEGDGAISYTVRADREFDVYYFTSRKAYERYESYIGGDDPGKTPSGHRTLSRVAVHNENRDLYEAKVPSDGGRTSITVEDTHYFVVDHSSYGMGVPVDEHADPLDAFVDLTAYNDTFPI